MSVAAVLLAAGEARRFGAAKQLARLEGRTLVRRAVDAALASACDPVFVVTGAHAERVEAELAALPVRLVRNDGFREGLASSIRAGVLAAAAVQPRVDGVALLLADQVRVSADLIDELVRRFRSGEGDAVACRYADTLGPPAVFGRRFFPALGALVGDRGARSILRALEGEVVEVPFAEGHLDVDTPDDLEALG